MTMRAVLLLAAAAAALAQDIALPVASYDGAVAYAPAANWTAVSAAGAFGGQGAFLRANKAAGVVTFRFPVNSTTLEIWGNQLADGGKYALAIDGVHSATIDVRNTTAKSTDPPVLLYAATGLTSFNHTVVLTNLLDTRVGAFGSMNIDHFVITGVPAAAVPPTFPADTTLAEAPLSASYRASISLGADAKLNGGHGKTVAVLLDTGSAGSWVVWSGCTESQCDGEAAFTASGRLANASITDLLVYGAGGAAGTVSTWRVNDTLAFGNASIPSTTLGAAFALPPGGAGAAGNIGLAKAFCGGHQCAQYSGFVEAMYADGLIAAPALSFFQLTAADKPAKGVFSSVALGGLDRSKFTGPIDWVPVTDASQWRVPYSTRAVNGVDATAQFLFPEVALATGDARLLGVPHADFATLTALGGGVHANSTWWFPCGAELSLGLRGSAGASYAVPLANASHPDAADEDSELCKALVQDAGGAPAWVLGAPFLAQYYVSFYYGALGVNSTVGFAAKNLAASAVHPVVLVGQA